MNETSMAIAKVLVSAAASSLLENTEFIFTFLLPAIVYGCFASSSHVWKGSWSIGAVACIALLHALDSSFLHRFFGTCVALVYYIAAAFTVFRLHKPVADGRVGKDSLFCIALLAYVVLPTLFFRSMGLVSALVVGWFMVLSSYSYCVDITRQRYSPCFADFLFFTFIDPSLSLPERSTEATGRVKWRNTSVRAMAGLAALTFGHAILTHFPALIDRASLQATTGAYAATLIRGSCALMAIYWVRSGLAEIRIVMLEALGLSVPPAYDKPYLAISPRDFWSRWNLYVGHWARRYVFGPVALHVARRTGQRSFARTKVPHLVAVLVTFLVIGALHDTLNFAGQGTTEFVYVRAFALAALVLLAWEGARFFARWAERVSAVRAPLFVVALVSRIGLLHYVVMLMVILGRV